jgi:hypothetical protein
MENKNICEYCQKDKHNECQSSLMKCECDCSRNTNNNLDILGKVAAITAGVGMTAAGIALTVTSGGLAVLGGGLLLGAGISSSYQGIENSIKKKEINLKNFATDVAFGALTGAMSGGAGGIIFDIKT